jgi:peptidoglycan/LPS O-acetylase OafA/YrhL
MASAGHGAEDVATIGACMLASLLAGWLLYRLVETPFMGLRARWAPAPAPVRPPACDAAAAPGRAS